MPFQGPILSVDCGSASFVFACIESDPLTRGVHGRSAATRPARAMEEKRDRSMMRTSGCEDWVQVTAYIFDFQ